jgi:hypothetical protein
MSEQEQTTGAGATTGSGNCVCGGAGPMFTDFLRRVGPPDTARRHFDQARLEILKGIRALIDHRIASISQHPPKGTNVPVE